MHATDRQPITKGTRLRFPPTSFHLLQSPLDLLFHLHLCHRVSLHP
ncbi:BnaCnng51210D [Brassica napus]|uniref:BnaCnng51210D protein n=1 Tax=Brassica napus TaxID=3708 RepID=A0A078JFX7_BRANA|nr:BnaCnng51210D [Brassica napus]